jgi:hypothetical protein
MTEAHIQITQNRSLKMVELNSGDVIIFIDVVDKNQVHHKLIDFTVPKEQRNTIADYLHE